jgi:dienelactone hydrolase
VTANLYIPDGATRQGAVVFALGHSAAGKQSARYMTVCQYLVRVGLVVIAFDPIGQGERLGYFDAVRQEAIIPPGSHEHHYVGVQCWPLGGGLARYFVHDVTRAVDYLCTRPEVDPAKIGITGNSGGGMQTALAMVCDERLAAAAPGTFITSRAAKMVSGKRQDAEQIWPGMSARGFDHEDALLAMAPKPVLVLAATEDFFPIEGTRRTVERVRRFWEMHGKASDIELFEDECAHMYSVPMAQAAAAFFAKHLLGKQLNLAKLQVELPEQSSLTCTNSGQVLGDYANARTVYDENCDRLNELERGRNGLQPIERQRRAREWLYRAVSENRCACSLNPRYLPVHQVTDEALTAQGVLWRSQEKLFNYGLLFRDTRYEGQQLPVTVAIWDGGTMELEAHLEWMRNECAQGRLIFVVDLCGAGALTPYPLDGMDDCAPTLRKLALDLLWLDDSLAAIRVHDVLKALELAQQLKGASSADLQFYTHGAFGVYVALAAQLDERIERVQAERPFGSFADWVRKRLYSEPRMTEFVLPGMLQYVDIS